ncbi:MAG: hypothetical protein P8Y71_27395, partial [Pseudolabrys sp.]
MQVDAGADFAAVANGVRCRMVGRGHDPALRLALRQELGESLVDHPRGGQFLHAQAAFVRAAEL